MLAVRRDLMVMGSGRRPLIGVMGAGEAADPEAPPLTEELGVPIARRGWGLPEVWPFAGGGSVGTVIAELELDQMALARQAIPTSRRRRCDLHRLQQA